MPAYLDRCSSDLLDLTRLVRGRLSGLERLTLGALITVDVHARDVVAELAEATVKSVSAGTGWAGGRGRGGETRGGCMRAGHVGGRGAHGGGGAALPRAPRHAGCAALPFLLHRPRTSSGCRGCATTGAAKK